jgi:hypothetical protein
MTVAISIRPAMSLVLIFVFPSLGDRNPAASVGLLLSLRPASTPPPAIPIELEDKSPECVRQSAFPYAPSHRRRAWPPGPGASVATRLKRRIECRELLGGAAGAQKRGGPEKRVREREARRRRGEGEDGTTIGRIGGTGMPGNEGKETR